MRYKFLTLLSFSLVTTLSINTIAQVTEIDPQETSDEPERESSKFWDKVVVGGNFGAQFGNVTAVDISPLIGYRFTPKFTAGVGYTYQFVKYKYPYDDPFNLFYDYKLNVTGGRVYAQQQLFYGLFAHAEYEYLWFKYESLETLETYKSEYPGLFLGGGYNLKIGRNSYLQFLALYNVLWGADNLIYASPFQLRFGFNIGL